MKTFLSRLYRVKKIREQIIIIAAATSLFLMLTIFFYPGLTSADTMNQLQQVQSQHYSDWHPISMAVIWSISSKAFGSISSLLLIQLALVWTGLLIMALYIYGNTGSLLRASSVLLVGLMPHVISLTGTLWKDSLLAACLMLVTAIALYVRKTQDTMRKKDNLGKRASVVAFATGVVLISIAFSLRSNAFAAAIPIAVYFVSSFWRNVGYREVAIVLLIVACGFLTPKVINYVYSPDQAHIEISMMAPDVVNTIKPDQIKRLNVNASLKDELTNLSGCSRFSGKLQLSFWACISSNGYGQNNAMYVYREELKAIWMNTIIGDPSSYFAFKTLAFMMFLFPDDTQYVHIQETQLKNPHRAEVYQALENVYVDDFGYRYFPFIYKAWFWLAAAMVLLGASLRSKSVRWLGVTVASSSILYILSFIPASVTPDYRYVFWPALVITLYVVLIALSGKKKPLQNLRSKLL